MTAIFYHTGFPQYHMVPFVLGASWVVQYWGVLRDRPGRVIAVACYFGWLAVFDVYYLFVNDDVRVLSWERVQDIVGLPTFLIGCAFLAAVVLSASRKSESVELQPGDSATNVAEAGVDRSV